MDIRKPHLKITKKTPAPKKPVDLGMAGAPLDHGHPFYFGFLATAGALISLTFLRALAGASQVFVLILISLFFAAGLNPAVEFFQRRGMKRGAAVGLIVAIVLTVVGLFSWIVIPPMIDQINLFIRNAPTLVSSLKNNSTINNLNQHFGVVDALQKKINASIHDGQFVVSAFGGVVGVGKAVLSGAFALLTLLVLTLYFTASLPQVTGVAYRLVPISRRARVAGLSDAIIARVGAFVASQATVAVIAGIFALLLGLILHVPYTTPVAVLVFLCGLVPLIGHFLGCTIFTLVALTKSPLTAIIVFVIYVIYVQIENYVVMPRIMKKSLSMPGLVTILAAMLGTSLLGPVGGLLAVPVAAAVMLILEEVVFPKQNLA
ncbi:MAG: AI-2E family transporter [Actinomycetes bacterium]